LIKLISNKAGSKLRLLKGLEERCEDFEEDYDDETASATSYRVKVQSDAELALRDRRCLALAVKGLGEAFRVS
jgi:hypothetical protein